MAHEAQLRERLGSGPLPVRKAVEVAIQIARGEDSRLRARPRDRGAAGRIGRDGDHCAHGSRHRHGHRGLHGARAGAWRRHRRPHVHVVDVAGGAPRLLSKEDAVQPVWSPSGRRIAAWQAIYITLDDQLVVVDIATGRRRVTPVSLGTTVNTESLALAPDGRTIYYGASRVEANVWMVTGK